MELNYDFDDPEIYEEGEPRPQVEDIDRIRKIVSRQDIPPGHVSVFFGEIAITWKRDQRKVRFSVNSVPGKVDFLYMSHPVPITEENRLGIASSGNLLPSVDADVLLSALEWLKSDRKIVKDASKAEGSD